MYELDKENYPVLDKKTKTQLGLDISYNNKENYSNLNKIVQHNSIITAHHKLNRPELLAFKQMISMINTEKPNRKIKLLKRDVINYIYPETKKKLINKGYYSKCKKYIDKLTEMSIEIVNKTENNRKIYDKFALCVQTHWDTGKEYLDVEFSDRILPFLVGLKGTFTQYEIGILPKLKSIYSIRMYECFNMKTHGKSFKWEEQIEILKEILGIKKTQYKEYSDFNKWVLKTAQEQINKYTDLHVEYEPIKTGRKTTSIMFAVTKVPTYINNIDVNVSIFKKNKKEEKKQNVQPDDLQITNSIKQKQHPVKQSKEEIYIKAKKENQKNMCTTCNKPIQENKTKGTIKKSIFTKIKEYFRKKL